MRGTLGRQTEGCGGVIDNSIFRMGSVSDLDWILGRTCKLLHFSSAAHRPLVWRSGPLDVSFPASKVLCHTVLLHVWGCFLECCFKGDLELDVALDPPLSMVGRMEYKYTYSNRGNNDTNKSNKNKNNIKQ